MVVTVRPNVGEQFGPICSRYELLRDGNRIILKLCGMLVLATFGGAISQLPLAPQYRSMKWAGHHLFRREGRTLTLAGRSTAADLGKRESNERVRFRRQADRGKELATRCLLISQFGLDTYSPLARTAVHLRDRQTA